MQFFATADEIYEMIDQVRTEFNLHATLVTQQPLRLVNFSDPKQIEADGFRHIFLSESPLSNSSSSFMQLRSENPNCIILAHETTRPNLREASMLGSPGSESMKKAHKRIKGLLRKISTSGMKVEVEGNPTVGYSKNHRYSKGAEKLSNSGVRLIGAIEKHRFFIA